VKRKTKIKKKLVKHFNLHGAKNIYKLLEIDKEEANKIKSRSQEF